MDILGVRIDNFSKQEILDRIHGFLGEERFHQIATVNQEFILEAQKNKELRDILNECSLNVADTIGLKVAFWKQGKKMNYRFPGADLMLEVLKMAENQNIGAFLAVNREGLSSYQETKDAILKIFPKLSVAGVSLDPQITDCQLPFTNASVLFCNFGSPQQEIFLAHQQGSAVRLAIGIGGSFDFLTGKIRRAPLFWRRLGLEWLWRLILEPRYRIKRVWNALLVFPIKIIMTK